MKPASPKNSVFLGKTYSSSISVTYARSLAVEGPNRHNQGSRNRMRHMSVIHTCGTYGICGCGILVY